MEKNSTFCVLPWMHVACNSSGNLRLCCNSTPTKNLILDAEGRPFKLNKEISSFDDAYNSDWMKKIRQDMLIGNKVSICERCYTEEESGVRSARQAWNEKYYEKVATEVQMTTPDGACDFKPIYMDLRLGNLCNLKCRMCNPYASKKWLEDWGKVESLEELSSDEIKRLSAMNWFDEDAFVQNLMSAIGSVEEIYFTGGEPLLIKKQFQLLEMLIENNYAKNITIKYNTNATFVPEKALAYWSKFKKVIINASVDGVGIVNEYIRNPSVWSEIDKNLRLLDAFIKDSDNATGSIHTTVQLYNLEHLLPLFEYVKKFNGFQRFPFLNILNHPQYLNIRNAPPTLKKAISKEILDWCELYKSEFSEEHQFAKLKEVVEYLNSKNLSCGNDFLLYSNEVDVLRKEEVSKVVPRLHSAITASY